MAGHSSTSHWRVAASNIILLVSWAIFVVVFLSASELIAVGILTMLGVGALYTVLRPSGLGSGKSKALMFQSIEFAMVAIFFGFFQLTLDATGLTISTTFGVAPGGSSLVGAGMLTLFLGLVFAFWALGLAWYPSRGYNLGAWLYPAMNRFIVIGGLAVDAILWYYTLSKFLSGVFVTDPNFPYEMLALVSSTITWPVLFFRKISSTRYQALLWIVFLSPEIGAVMVKLYQLGVF